MSIAETLLPEFDQEMATTRRLLERVPAHKGTWNHLIHHRGQLSVYLRLNDVPLPPIYGPTADERM